VRILALAAAALASIVLLTGCPKPYPACADDEACKDHNEVCVQGQCQECATDANCKPGFVCDANKCVPKPECVKDNECGANKKCHGGKCVTDAVQKAPGSCSTDADCQSGQRCEDGTCVAKDSGASCSFEPIYFEFNEYKLEGAAQSQLASLADCMKKDKGHFTLEGHADERGTEEYNLQLSNKRAASVKRYLADLGVAANALDTVGYGENRPAVNASSESAWAKNRRVEFKKK
jgi:peptidoglycan-associated lipoprotein